MVSPVSGPFRGRAQGRAQGSENGTRKQGGVYQQEKGGCITPPSIFPPAVFGLFVLEVRPETPFLTRPDEQFVGSGSDRHR